MQKIIFVNRYYYPDISATSQILGELSFALAKNGYQQCVIASASQYDSEQKPNLPAFEKINNVEVHRVQGTNFGRGKLIGRSIDSLTFIILVLWKLLRIAHKNDLVVIKTDPPLASIPISWVCRFRKVNTINWLQDLFPEVASELGVPALRGKVGLLARNMRNAALHRAVKNIAIGGKMAEYLGQQGLANEKIVVIENWADESQVFPVSGDKNYLRDDWGLRKKFVVGYSGNLGRAHLSDEILAAAEILSSNNEIKFLFIGSGSQLGELKERVAKRGLENVIFKPYQAKKTLPYSLSLPDVHLVSLNPRLEGLIVPSKFYGIMAVGRPCIFLGDSDGEIARNLLEHQIGYTVSNQDGAALAGAIQRLSEKTEDPNYAQEKIRQQFLENYSKQRAINAWTSMLTELGIASA